MKQILLLLTITSLAIHPGITQPRTYRIPFASAHNTIEIGVENVSSKQVDSVRVTARDVPSWLHIENPELLLDQLNPNKEKTALFSFAVDKSAPVNKEERVRFNITTPSGETWTKDIVISVAPPEKFELFQNYPNPFNPLTVISYQLSASTFVTLTVYNVLGEQVATVVDEQREAGYHEKFWTAVEFPSGLYFYQLSYSDPQGNRLFERKRMVLLR